MKGSKKCSLIALIVAFAATFTMAFAVGFGKNKVLAGAANIYEVGVNATSEVVEREGKPAYKINIGGGYGARAANSVPCDLTDLAFDLYDVSGWTVGEGANSLFIAFTDGFNRFYNEEYVNGVTIGIYHSLAGESHSYKLVLYKGWVGAPYINNGAWYETPAVSDPAGDKLTLSFYMNDDNTAWVMDLNGGTVAVPADVFGTGKAFYPEETVSMNNVYMMVSSMSAGSITVTANRKAKIDDTAYNAALAVIEEYKVLAAAVNTQETYNAAMAKRAEIVTEGLTDEQLADIMVKLAAADAVADENLAWFSFDTRTPFGIGSAEGKVGSRLIDVNGTQAYKLAIQANCGFGYRLSSTVAYDLTTLGFDILKASSSIIERTTANATHTYIAFTDGVNRYNTEFKNGLTLSFEHAIADGHHTYKLLFNQGWFEGNVWLNDNGNLYTLQVTDPTDDKLHVQFAKSENGANLVVSMNDQSVALPMSLFGVNGRMYKESADQINNVYFIYGTMNTAANTMVIANLEDSKTLEYKATAAYTDAFANLNGYVTGLTTAACAQDLIDAIEKKNAISTEGLRSYDANYVNYVLNVYEGVLAAARVTYAEGLLDYDVTAYENAAESIATIEDSFLAQQKKALIDAELLASSEEMQARVAAADAKFVEKTDAVAKAVSADALAKINAANTAALIREADAIVAKFTTDYMGLISSAAVEEVNATLASIAAKRETLTAIDGWTSHGNAIKTKNGEELNFVGSAYAGIADNGSLNKQNDAMFYDEAFRITNFSMEFTLKKGLTEGWFSVGLMAKQNDIFSAAGSGEAFCGKHKGIVIWLQPKANDKVIITVFALKDDSTQIYAARKTEAYEMAMPADGKFVWRMYQAEGSNELTMLLNNENILNSKIRIPELNTIYGQQQDASAHKGYMAVIGCVSNVGEYFDFSIARINGKNVFDAAITTPDPSNVPAKEQCDHDYDPDTGYCTKCGELNPDFNPNSGNSGNKDGENKGGCGGCKGSAGDALGIFAVLAVLGAVVACKKRKE